jgi:hypothetical protein
MPYYTSSRVLASNLATVALGFGISNTVVHEKIFWESICMSLICAFFPLLCMKGILQWLTRYLENKHKSWCCKLIWHWDLFPDRQLKVSAARLRLNLNASDLGTLELTCKLLIWKWRKASSSYLCAADTHIRSTSLKLNDHKGFKN